MSASTVGQLRESYARVAEATLRRAREAGILRESPLIDELRSRWEAAVGRHLAAMEERCGSGRPGAPSTALGPPEAFAGPTQLPAPLQAAAPRYAHMEHVAFADDFVPPHPLEDRSPETVRRRAGGGFGASQEDAPPGPMLAAGPREGASLLGAAGCGRPPPVKRPSTDASAKAKGRGRGRGRGRGGRAVARGTGDSNARGPPVPPSPAPGSTPAALLPLASQATGSAQKGSASPEPNADNSDNEYNGCFGDDEVGGVRSTARAPPPPPSPTSGCSPPEALVPLGNLGAGEATSQAAGLAQKAPAVSGPNAVEDDSDDDYDGCLDGDEAAMTLPGASASSAPTSTGPHEVSSNAAPGDTGANSNSRVVGAKRPRAGASAGTVGDKGTHPGAEGESAPSSTEGTELGSDLDDSEFDLPETENVLLAEFKTLHTSKIRRRWKVVLGPGLLRVQGVECLFSHATGTFDVAWSHIADPRNEGGAGGEPPQDALQDA